MAATGGLGCPSCGRRGMSRAATPRNHLKVADAAARLGHSDRWLKERIKDGSLEGFRWSANDITVSVESIVAFENRSRVSVGVEMEEAVG